MFDGMPLHPLLVHAPLVLGVLAPFVALALWAAIAGRYLHHRIWWLVVVLHAVAFGGAVLAVKTGHVEHDRIETVVDHDKVEVHEERGENYRLALGVGLALSLLTGLAFADRKWGMRLGGVTVLAGFAAAWLGLGVGHSGSLLVYREGAANYYVDPGTPTGPRVIRAAPGDSADAHAEAPDHQH